MMKFVIAAAMLVAFSAHAQTAQPCGGRAPGSLIDKTNNFKNLMPDSSAPVRAKATGKGKGVR